jgi:hypothetical protein
MRAIVALALLAALGACTDTLGAAAIGAACTAKTDCASGLCLGESAYGQTTGWAGGACVATCTGTTCSEGTCVALETASYCLATCAAATDCRTGYVCDTSVKACVPDCNKGFSCGTKLTCQTDGTCRSASSQTTTTTGMCKADYDCRDSSLCPTTAGLGCACVGPTAALAVCKPICKSKGDCPSEGSGKLSFCSPMGLCEVAPAGG